MNEPATKSAWDLGSKLLNEQLGTAGAISPLVLQAVITDKKWRIQLESLLKNGQDINPLIDTIRSSLAKDEQEKTMPKLAVDGIESLWLWLRDGFGVVSPSQYEKRLSACKVCPYYNPEPKHKIYQLAAGLKKPDPVCNKCGCTLAKKLKMTTANCPEAHPANQAISLWEEPRTKSSNILPSVTRIEYSYPAAVE